jgi:uncharacterized protein YxjI
MEIERDGDTPATVKKAMISPLRDRFSVSVRGGPDVPLVLAIAVCIDGMTRG